MAHSAETKRNVRDMYVDKLLPLKVISTNVGIAEATLRRWRLAAKDAGDCWDAARTAARSTGVAGEFTMDLLERFATTIEETLALIDTTEMSLDARIKAQSSVADQAAKINRLAGGGNAKVAKRKVALTVIQKLTQHIQHSHSDIAVEFTKALQTFAPIINKELDNV